MNEVGDDEGAVLDAELFFAMIPEWILMSKEIEPSDKIVWGVLQRFANKRHVCWPGHATIAENANVSKRQVQRCLDRLEKAGMLERKRRKKKVADGDSVSYLKDTNVYTLRFNRPRKRKVEKWTIVADTDPVVEVKTDAEEDTMSLGGRDTMSLGGRDTMSHKPEPLGISISKDTLVSSAVPDSDDSQSALRADAAKLARAKQPRGKRTAYPAKKLEPTRYDVEQLCDTMVMLLLRNGARKQEIKITNDWRKHARLLLDKDGASLEEALDILRWSQNDGFWRDVILSMPKFRQKYLQLRMRARSDRERSGKGNGDYWRDLARRAEEVDNANTNSISALEQGKDEQD